MRIWSALGIVLAAMVAGQVHTQTVVSGCGYVGSSATTYILSADLACNLSSGVGVTLPSGSTLDGQGHKITNAASTANTAFGIATVNANNVTIKNVTVSGFMYGVYFQGQSGSGHRLLDSDLTGYFRGARVEGNDWEVVGVTVHDVGGTTVPGYTFSFGIEVYGRGMIHKVNVTNTFTTTDAEAVGISVSEYSNTVAMMDIEVWNPTRRAKSIGLWVGGTAPKPNVALTNVFISNMDSGVYGTATVTAYNVHQHNVGYPWNLSTGLFIDAGNNYPLPDEPASPPPDLVDLVPVMTGSSTSGVTATASSGAIYPAWHIAAGPESMEQFNSSGAGYVRFDLPAPAIATQYALSARVNEPRWAPKSFQLICNATGGDVVLDTRTNVVAWSAGEQRTYTFTNTMACPAYTLNITASLESPYLQVSNVRIRGPE